MTELFYAHSKDGEPPDRWQPLEKSMKISQPHRRVSHDGEGK
jgi:hypothetical protein